jgi:Ca2+-binding RTX toxin-like protein
VLAVRIARLGTFVMAAGALLLGAATAQAAYTSAPVANVFQGGAATPGTLMSGDAAGDSLTITIGPDVLEHDRFGIDPGFASAQDFDTNAAGVQTFPSTFATRLMVDGGAGQDTVRFIDGRPDNATEWLHAGPSTPCVGQVIDHVATPAFCYRAGTVEAVTLDGGSGDDRISSLDAFAGTPLTLAGGDGDDSLSQDGEDGVHRLDAPVTVVGGAGNDEAALTEDQSGSLAYTIGDGKITGTDYAPVSYDDTAEFVTLYTRLGPDNDVKVTERAAHQITVWDSGGTVDARGAGPQAGVFVRSSLFDLGGDQGAIRFRGGPADDLFFGTEKGDRASGGGGSDQVNGEGGNDRLNGGAQRDLIDGGDGRDRIGARDKERDSIDCGASKDKAKVDKHEGSLRGCEVVSKPK